MAVQPSICLKQGCQEERPSRGRCAFVQFPLPGKHTPSPVQSDPKGPPWTSSSRKPSTIPPFYPLRMLLFRAPILTQIVSHHPSAEDLARAGHRPSDMQTVRSHLACWP